MSSWTASNAYTAKDKSNLRDFQGHTVKVTLHSKGYTVAFYESKPGGRRLPERWEGIDAAELALVLNSYLVKAGEQ